MISKMSSIIIVINIIMRQIHKNFKDQQSLTFVIYHFYLYFYQLALIFISTRTWSLKMLLFHQCRSKSWTSICNHYFLTRCVSEVEINEPTQQIYMLSYLQTIFKGLFLYFVLVLIQIVSIGKMSYFGWKWYLSCGPEGSLDLKTVSKLRSAVISLTFQWIWELNWSRYYFIIWALIIELLFEH